MVSILVKISVALPGRYAPCYNSVHTTDVQIFAMSLLPTMMALLLKKNTKELPNK